jgi:NAD(P)-dependent dehydrogenase (short-subunit alcohol dehydrogenase family)
MGDEMSDRLKGKTAIVFGAGGPAEGVTNGAAASIAYAREGALVVAVDINREAAERTVAAIRDEGGEAIAFVADVTSAEQVKAAVDAAVAAFGRIDILHNNVALNSPGGPVEMEEEMWDRIMALNTKSLFLACKYVIPLFKAQGGGVITNISSIAGVTFYGRPTIAYASSKAALNQFTRAVAAQHGPDNIRCNAILPGSIDTPRSYKQLHTIWKGDVEKMHRVRAQAVPLRRLGSAWDVAKAAVFLASDDANYITGVVLPVDGGICVMGPQANND